MSDRFAYEWTDRDGNVISEGKFSVDLVEYGVQNWPDGMEGCRLFRIEYGGHAQDCVAEATIWIPPTADRDKLEKFLSDMFREWDEEEYRRDNPDSGWLPPKEDVITLPNPGSELALRHGCRCPVLDNHHGKGMPGEDGPVFWINEECDMHGGLDEDVDDETV